MRCIWISGVSSAVSASAWSWSPSTPILPNWRRPRVRGRAFAYANIIQFIAIPVAALLGWWLVPRTFFGLDGWRFVVMAGSVGAVMAWFVRARLPESPRWLAGHGRAQEAEAIVEIWEVEARLEGAELPPPKPQPVGTGQGFVRGNLAGALSRPHPDVDRLQPVPGGGLLRFFKLGARASDRQRHRGDQEPGLYLCHRHCRAHRPGAGPVVHRPHRTQMDRGGSGAGDCGKRASFSPRRMAWRA